MAEPAKRVPSILVEYHVKMYYNELRSIKVIVLDAWTIVFMLAHFRPLVKTKYQGGAMKKLLSFLVCCAVLSSAVLTPASAEEGEQIRVGLRYGSSALFAANLENAEGQGYEFGRYDSSENFHPLGETGETTITMIADGNIYMNTSGTYSSQMPSGVHRFLGGWHIQFSGYRDFTSASADARDCGGWPAWIDGEYVVRTGSYDNQSEAEAALSGRGELVRSDSAGILVTRTGSEQILFEYADSSGQSLGVRPIGWDRGSTKTWFKGYRYQGGFEYARKNGGNLNVINVVDVEDYVKGVVPYEMSADWPLAALEAQAVCARTYAKSCTKHRSDGFDVCNGNHCQVYQGLNTAKANSDRAVDNTAGQCIYYQNTLIRDPVYHSSDGGATEDAKNVWGGDAPYLRGKVDPYEAKTKIPEYQWSVTYTADELSWILDQKGHSVGRVRDVQITKRTPLGHVQELVIVGDRGKKVFTGDRCSTIFYSSTYKKSVRSLDFTINGEGGGGQMTAGVCVNDAGTVLPALRGASAISSGGTTSTLTETTAAAISSNGLEQVSGGRGVAERRAAPIGGEFVITGRGSGHHVGLSQYGARAMAEQGYTYQDILKFYYTDITIG